MTSADVLPATRSSDLTEQMRELRQELVALHGQLPSRKPGFSDPLNDRYNAVVDAADKLAGTLADRGLIDLEAVCRT